MRIYRLAADADQVRELDLSLDLRKRLQAHSTPGVASTWQPLELSWYDTRRPAGDLASSDQDLPILRKPLAQALEPLLGAWGEFLPLQIAGESYLYYSCTTLLPESAVDRPACESHYLASVELEIIDRFAFKPDELGSALAFRVPQAPWHVFFRGEVWDQLKRAGATGIRARVEWSDEPMPPEPPQKIKPRAAKRSQARRSTALPLERALTPADEQALIAERNAALVEDLRLPVTSTPEEVVAAIARRVDEVRNDPRKNHDELDLRLGSLYGDQLVRARGLSWVHLSWPSGWKTYAVVPQDRSFSVAPIDIVAAHLAGETPEQTLALLFKLLVKGPLPVDCRPRSYQPLR